MNNKLYTLRTKEALDLLAENNIPIKSEKTLKRYREAGKLSAQTRPDETNKFRETVFYNREELLKLGQPEEQTMHEPVVDKLGDLETGLQIPNVKNLPEIFSAFAHVLQKTQSVNESINEKILNLSEAAKESGLTREQIKAAIEAGQIIARKGKAQRRVLNGKEFTSNSFKISRVSLLAFAHAWLREEPVLTAKAAKA